MVINLYEKVCTNCGIVDQHTRDNCPEMQCFRCHQKGHMGKDCLNTECSYCRKTGHSKAKCPKLELKKICQQGHTNDKNTVPSIPSSTKERGSCATPRLSTLSTKPRLISQRVGGSQNALESQPTDPSPDTQKTTTVSPKDLFKWLIY